MIYYYCDLGNTNVTENQIESVFQNHKHQKTKFRLFCKVFSSYLAGRNLIGSGP